MCFIPVDEGGDGRLFSAGNLGRWSDGTPDCGMVPRGLANGQHSGISGFIV